MSLLIYMPQQILYTCFISALVVHTGMNDASQPQSRLCFDHLVIGTPADRSGLAPVVLEEKAVEVHNGCSGQGCTTLGALDYAGSLERS